LWPIRPIHDAETDAAFALKLTAAGVKAAAAADAASSDNETGAGEGEARALGKPAASTPDAKAEGTAAHLANDPRDRSFPRPTSKLTAVVALLSRSEGASLGELIDVAGTAASRTWASDGLGARRRRKVKLLIDRPDS